MPDDTTTQNKFGLETDHFKRGEFDKAIAYYTRVIDKNPYHSAAHVYFNRGVAYHAKGRHDKAITDYTRAIDKGPDFVAKAYYNRGLAYRAKGEHDKAIADYTHVIDKGPEFVAKAYCSRGLAYHDKGEHDKAIADYTHVIDKGPEFVAKAYCNRGVTYSVKGEYDKAIADYTRVIDKGPDFVANAYYNRGLTYRQRGECYLAIADHYHACILSQGDTKSHGFFTEYMKIHDSFTEYLSGMPKKKILSEMKKLPQDVEIALLHNILYRKTPLGERFWKKEGLRACRVSAGKLKEVRKRYNFLTKEHVEVRMAARILNQVSRSEGCAFFNMPPEIGVKIASSVAKDLSRKTAEKIARTYYTRPILK